MLPTRIVVIGAGSAIFGLNTISALMGSERLRGSRVALVDRNAETLALIARLAERLNREWDAGMTITAHTHHASRNSLPLQAARQLRAVVTGQGFEAANGGDDARDLLAEASGITEGVGLEGQDEEPSPCGGEGASSAVFR